MIIGRIFEEDLYVRTEIREDRNLRVFSTINKEEDIQKQPEEQRAVYLISSQPN